MVENVVRFAQVSGFYGSQKGEYAQRHGKGLPVLIAISGPGGRREDNSFKTIISPPSQGGSAPFDLTQQLVWTMPADAALWTIGRAQGQHVQIANECVSKFHASIRRPIEGTGFEIHDETSSHGTALAYYKDRVGMEEDRRTEQYDCLDRRGKRALEDRVVIELAGTPHGTRLAFFTEYGSVWEYLKLATNRD